MGVDLLNVAKSGLFAASAAINTTGNNIANANSPGYTRQRVVQSSNMSVLNGGIYFGNGAKVDDARRVFNEFLNTQVIQAQSVSSGVDTYLAQVTQIDNMLSDPESGLTPAVQDFFKGVQNLSSNPTQARQALLSNAETMAGRFRSMEARLVEIGDGVNSEISTNVLAINANAKQLARLNESITALTSASGNAPNDLLDQRDQVVAELSKLVKVSVSKENGSYTVSFGTGQPLVVGNSSYALTATPSPTDTAKLVVGYEFGGKTVTLSESTFQGGALGGLLEFRSQTLDQARNSLGRIGIALAQAFNEQHRLGQDSNGAMGGNFFTEPVPRIVPSKTNSPGNDLVVGATIADSTALTTSDYELRFDGANYTVMRLTDGNKTIISPYPQTGPQRIDGIDFSLSSPAKALRGDTVLIQPTIYGASTLGVAITDINKIAAAAPVSIAARSNTTSSQGNVGTAQTTVGKVDASFTMASVTPAVTLTYDRDAVPPSFAFEQGGVPLTMDVLVTQTDGTSINYPAGTPVTFTNGATISFGGVSFNITGDPADNDSFTVGANTGGVGDNRNAQLLAALQTKNIVNGGRLTFQSAYAGIVGQVGNKTAELQITSESAASLLAQTDQANQSVSGVNLDEEAANLLKYQQAYQAAGKVIQIASQLFETLMNMR
jgi:flagellar hook-associated protein 1 FlgK